MYVSQECSQLYWKKSKIRIGKPEEFCNVDGAKKIPFIIVVFHKIYENT